MESIFHEKQEGALCAQHCLNSLLQGSYFNAVDLSMIAKNLDDEERIRMAEGNIESIEYQNFLQQPSSNMDDSGYFSIQVIAKALEVWNLEMIPYNSRAAEYVRQNPTAETAYICNQQNHWLTIRKLGSQWFNLNSIKAYPELISDTYLSLLLAQLQAEGYSIFIIQGNVPSSEAEELLRLCPISSQDYKEFVELQRQKSLAKKDKNSIKSSDKNLENKSENVNDATEAEPVDPDAVRMKRLQYFSKQANSSENENKEEAEPEPEPEPKTDPTDMSEEEMLKFAMAMSMEKME